MNPDNPAAGFFFDGRTAGRKPVRIELGGASLRLVSAADGAVLAQWPFERLRLLAETDKGGAGVIGCDLDEEARLAVSDPAIHARLAAFAQGRRAAAHRRHLKQAAMLAAAALGAAAALWLGWGTAADLAVDAIPRSWETPIGRSVVAELVPQDSVCAAPAGQAALDGLVARLARPLGGAVSFHAQVMRGNAVNAFALPGGEIVLLSGLIDKAESMDEVAGVLAHEMAHVIERHSMRLMRREPGLSLLAGLALGAARAPGALSTVTGLAYSRRFESEADARGLELLRQAGVRGGGLASFFARAEKERGADPGVLRYLATHPPPAERFSRALGPGRDGAAPMREAEWRSLRAICKQD
ncbi:MAG: M48 family metallopeptidase [Rhodospirillales bacterium]